MKLTATLVGVLLYLTTVNGNQDNNVEGLSDEKVLQNIRIARELGANEMRHRRKRWHSNYGYNNYQHFNYPDDRRDSEQDTISQIMRLLDEISDYVRRPPPPPPQPIYIPYPMPYPVPQYCNCRANASPNLTERFPIMDDTNQNWGFVDEGDDQNGFDGNRPISFDPITPIRSSTSRPRPVEHGSSQAGVIMPLSVRKLNSNTQASPPKVTPTQCDAAVLSCCGPNRSKAQQRRCFASLGCDSTYANGNGCSQSSISSVLDIYKNAYAAIN